MTIAKATNTNWTVLITGLPAIIAAFVLAFQAYVNSVKAEAKTDVLIEKTQEIHTLTNSNLTAITTELRVANARIAGMEKLITELMTDKQAREIRDGMPVRGKE